jgi:hypothetical protein
MMNMRCFAATGFLFVATAAWAGESMINGSPLEYNRAYRCKGERVIVAHCRDNDDSSYCQVVYPDRPYQNGMQVAPVEMRGDVIAKLNACSQTASAPPTAPAPATAAPGKSTGSYASTGKPPGVGKASWYMMGYDAEDATFFTRARMKRTGSSADGWFTVVYVRPKDVPGAHITAAQYSQRHYLANCAKGTMRLSEAAYLDEDGKLLNGAFIPESQSPFAPPNRDSIDALQFNILCGKPQPLAVPDSVDTDGLGLVFIYHGLLQQDAKK